ncbi:MAG: hypothetical protein QSU88_01700, partial [Candidatus Methanoperedens sp.]|nr:hypothetical protein [Candidatus Methanoperedens sp.]
TSAATQEQSASMDQLVNAAQELSRLSNELLAEVAKFNLGEAVKEAEHKPALVHESGSKIIILRGRIIVVINFSVITGMGSKEQNGNTRIIVSFFISFTHFSQITSYICSC